MQQAMPRICAALKGTAMKINMEVDLTPDEARRVMGLPDLTPLHDRYIAMVGATMEGNVRPELMENLVKSWAPMGEAGMAMWRRLFETARKSD